MGIIADIGKIALDILDFGYKIYKDNKEKQKEKIKEKLAVEKTLVQLRAEIFDNRDRINELLSGGQLKSIKANDEALRKHLARIKISAMNEVRLYPGKFKKISSKNKKIKDFFDALSITVSKIKRLKELSNMSDKELKLNPPVRLTVRFNHIIKYLNKLIEQETGKKTAKKK
jgi:hypothetical protein